MSKWDQLKEMKSGGDFVKLKNDKDEIMGVFRGEPEMFFAHYDNATRKSTLSNHFFEKNGVSAKKRFRINFVTKEGEKYVCKIFEGGAQTAEALVEAMDEYGLDVLFKIKRSGTGMDTKYSIMFKDKLTPEKIEQINAIDQIDLTILERGEDPATQDFPSSMDEVRKRADDIPF